MKFFPLFNYITTFTRKLGNRICRILESWPILSVSIFIALTTNIAFWQTFFKLEGEFTIHVLLFAVAMFIFMVSLTSLLVQLLHFRFTLKPLLMALLVLSSITSYFMDHYGIVIDVAMMHNVFETDTNEVADLVGWGLVGHVLLFGIIPALVIFRLKITFHPLPRQLWHNALRFFALTAILVTNYLAFSADYSSFFRNHHHERYLINPVNYVYSIGKVVSATYFKHDNTIVNIGLDARQVKPANSEQRKSVLILVVGETARADNFSLNGYQRNTNPRLGTEDIINYPNVHSCGTSTHVSLPCMFSHLERDEFDESEAKYYESLPDVLQHAGIDVVWRDNNSGCKGVCNNVKYEDLSHLNIPSECDDRECFDEVLLENLNKIIESSDKDKVIVLHQKGSHGPAYYLRYPEQFNRFQPTCESNELYNCSQQALVNTYDNTIAYTDYFLSRVIELLKKEQNKFDTAMLYISDHGESLGENHLYLHSLPYVIAPESQKHVPMITWYSAGFLKDHKLDKTCLQQAANKEYSHDNLFHSILSLMNVSTRVYKPELDIYRNCNANTTLASFDHT